MLTDHLDPVPEWLLGSNQVVAIGGDACMFNIGCIGRNIGTKEPITVD
jgi:hypothetical protein